MSNEPKTINASPHVVSALAIITAELHWQRKQLQFRQGLIQIEVLILCLGFAPQRLIANGGGYIGDGSKRSVEADNMAAQWKTAEA